MFSKEEKEAFLEEMLALIETDFTGIDVCRFVRNNSTAQYLLSIFGLCDYEKQIEYINEHDDCELESVLKIPTREFYDPDYGNEDPLMGFRLEKACFQDDDEEPVRLTLDYLWECDNLFSHMLWKLEEEDEEILLEEILNKENLNKLYDGGYDCKADQIYYFEKIENEHYRFSHYFRTKDGWDCNEYNFYLNNVIFFGSLYFDGYENFEEVECHFYYYFEFAYREYLLTQNRFYEPLHRVVYNGVEAMNQLKDYFSIELRCLYNKWLCEKNRRKEVIGL